MLFINNIPVTPIQFPDKTPKLDLSETQHALNVADNLIRWNYESDAEMILLYYLTKHIRNRYPKAALYLHMPYVPNARFDRVKDEDEVFTLKYFAEFINGLEFDAVYTLDVHSNVSGALFDHIIDRKPIPQIKQVLSVLEHPYKSDDLCLFFPDEGAMKRYSEIAGLFDLPYVFGSKNRDWKTGEILSLDVCNPSGIDLKGKTILIVDDICSKGGTFYHSAKKLKEFEPKAMYLYVSHCENTIAEGELLSSDLIQKIFTTDSLLTMKHDKIQVLKLS